MDSITNTYVDKSKWQRGPWDDEADKVQWEDPDTGLPCLMLRGPVGSWCGYVGVRKDHPAYGLPYYDRTDNTEDDPLPPAQTHLHSIGVHGGLTYSGEGGPNDQVTGRAVKPEAISVDLRPGEDPDLWWFGFDCAHYSDLAPAVEAGSVLSNGTYRVLGYVEEQVTMLAHQLYSIRGYI